MPICYKLCKVSSTMFFVLSIIASVRTSIEYCDIAVYQIHHYLRSSELHWPGAAKDDNQFSWEHHE